MIKAFFAKKMMTKKSASIPLEQLEARHTNSLIDHFNDSSYFNGRGYDGSSFVARMAFQNTGQNEWWLRFRLPGKGKFDLKTLIGSHGAQFEQGTLRFICLETGKRWKVAYEGMLQDEQGNSRQAKIDLTFEATGPIVNFKVIKPATIVHKAIAEEKWNKVFFKKLKEISKQHYEQPGTLSGNIEIDGELTTVSWFSMRDHSFGIRNWSDWKRHCWFGGILDDGRAFNLSGIAYRFLNQLQAGFYLEDGKITGVEKTLSLTEISRKELIPEALEIPFTLHNGIAKTLRIKILDCFLFEMTDNYKIFEGMAEYELDGVRGLGVSEFGFNPEFFPRINKVFDLKL